MFVNYSFEITHFCNRFCKDCSHHIKTSDYTFLTLLEYKYIAAKIKNKRISEIEIIGGEPLMHPDFELLMSKIFTDFKKSRIILITNGKLLPNLKSQLRSKFHRIYISYYKGFNEKEISSLINEPNIFINYTEFLKTDDFKRLKKKKAKLVSKICSNKIRRLVGTRLYNCCLAESIERIHLNKPIHTDLMNNNEWEKKFKEPEPTIPCQYCIAAESVLNNKIKNISHKFIRYLLLNSPIAGFNHDWLWRIWRKRKNAENWNKQVLTRS